MCDIDMADNVVDLADVSDCETDDISDFTDTRGEVDMSLTEDEASFEDISNQEELGDINSDEISEDDVCETSGLFECEEIEIEDSNGFQAGGLPDVSQEIRSVADLNVTTPILPISGGHWSDSNAIGDSIWIPDDAAEVKWQKGGEWHSISGAELKEMYGIEGIEYHGNEPDFSELEDVQLGHAELEEFSTERLGSEGTYELSVYQTAKKLGWSEDEVRQYMDDHGLTWHECGDRKTVRAIPTEINAAFKHTGGISIEKSIEAVSDAINDQYGNIKLEKKSLVGTVNNDEFKDALENVHRIYKSYKG